MAGVLPALWPGVINPLVFHSFKQQLSYSQTRTLTGYLDYSNPLFVTVKSCARLSPETEVLLAGGTSSLAASSPARIVFSTQHSHWSRGLPCPAHLSFLLQRTVFSSFMTWHQ